MKQLTICYYTDSVLANVFTKGGDKIAIIVGEHCEAINLLMCARH